MTETKAPYGDDADVFYVRDGKTAPKRFVDAEYFDNLVMENKELKASIETLQMQFLNAGSIAQACQRYAQELKNFMWKFVDESSDQIPKDFSRFDASTVPVNMLVTMKMYNQMKALIEYKEKA